MPETNFDNRTLFHGDNLGFLRGLNSESIDLIATDPPFKKGRDFHATPDSLAAGARFQDRWAWERDVHQEWVDQITDDHPALMEAIESARYAHSDSMGAFMCFMAVRIMEMHRVLKGTGSIYLHCDWSAAHYLKAVMDAVFGHRQFKNDIAWQYGRSGRGAKAGAQQFPRNHDSILHYAKDERRSYHEAQTVQQRHPVNALPSHIRKGDDGRYFKTSPRGDYTDESVERLRQEGRIHVTRNGNIRIKYFLALDRRGLHVLEPQVLGDVWEVPDMMHTPKAERTGFKTQKPLNLYEIMIQASSREGDIVLDPFAGCATTCVAAERLRRRWIGMDIWDGALNVVKQRMEDSRQLLTDIPEINYETEIPERTDDGETASPHLRVKVRVAEPAGPRWTRSEMYEFLLEQNGSVCQGCDREFDDPRYLELDHNTPRADGGLNHVSNRVLLCGPCNRLKSNIYTLSGLRRENKKRGYMASS